MDTQTFTEIEKWVALAALAIGLLAIIVQMRRKEF